eukprot:362831-Chlamydomonas_euryale.AAC.3
MHVPRTQADRIGNLQMDCVKALSVPSGSALGLLKERKPVVTAEGLCVTPDMVISETKPGEPARMDVHGVISWNVSMHVWCFHISSVTLTVAVTLTLAFLDAMNYMSSVANLQSLYGEPLTRPRPGSTALPGYRVAH